MLILYNGEYQEYDVTKIPGAKQILEGLEKRKEDIGQQYGDYEIVTVDYDWGSRKRIQVAKCVNCGHEKEIPNLSDFKRGKGVGQFCSCRYKKKPYIPIEETYRSNIGKTIGSFRLVDYRKGTGFRIECEECGKQRWVSGKRALSGEEVCNHRVSRNYSDPKYMGMRVGNLTVIGREGKLFRFRCDCGTEFVQRPTNVFRIESIKTCGREECPHHREVQKAGSVRRKKGVAFERECAEVLQKQGFLVEMTPESGDYGVDFFAFINEEKVAFQCKHLKISSVVHAVQEVYAGGRYYDCCKFVVVSPSGFSYPAELMASKLGVQLEKDLQNFQLKTLKENKIATQKIKSFSKRTLIWEIDGVVKTAEQWCKEYGLSKSCIRSRVESGMDLKTALMTPKHKNSRSQIEIDGVTKTKQEWCDQYGITMQLFDYRVKYSKLSPKEALTKPKQRN